jgi:cellulose synthase/poly-beta-1,6-N-acetylglucosamine synthase-like glycosyltransferase
MHISCPSEQEMIAYVKNRRWLYIIPGVLSFFLLTAGLFLFAFSHASLFVFVPFIAIVVGYLSLSYLIVALGKTFNLPGHREMTASLQKASQERKVDVYLPICGEDKDIILNVWDAAKKMEWPADKLSICVLDDSKTDDMRVEAESRGFRYIRRETREFKKAGNLLNAFNQTDGDFILILDADFVPRPDFLVQAIPYFISNPKIAIVQTPQFFEVSSWMHWIEAASGYVQELFYRLVQQSRDRWGGTICVGSCAIYSREALNSIGGPRQIEHSEDVWTGFTCVENGWTIKYLPLNLSKGRCPDNLRAFFNQQYRWCSGSMSLCFGTEFWKSSLTIMQKLCYFSGMAYYMTSALGIFLLQIPAITMVNFYPQQVFWFNIIFYGPSFVFGTVMVWLWSSYDRHNLDFLRLRHVSYYAHLYALRDRLLKRTVGWIATGQKTIQRSRFDDYRNLCFWYSTVSLLLIISGAFRNFHVTSWYNFIPPVCFAIFNFWLSMSSLRDQS